MGAPEANRTVVVRHEQGLHARPAEMVARAAMAFSARVEIVRDGQRVDAKSILNILTLGATQGTTLLLEACGEDAAAAVDKIAELVEGDFEQ
ncbi:MAG: HPr family phosphocarrier protein [Planctomycetota bacterium]